MHERLLTANEVAKILNISQSKVYSLMSERKIPTITIGKNVRVSIEDLEKFLAMNRSSNGLVKGGEMNAALVINAKLDRIVDRHADLDTQHDIAQIRQLIDEMFVGDQEASVLCGNVECQTVPDSHIFE
jgi:excisionase family DNA binding protein